MNDDGIGCCNEGVYNGVQTDRAMVGKLSSARKPRGER